MHILKLQILKLNMKGDTRALREKSNSLSFFPKDVRIKIIFKMIWIRTNQAWIQPWITVIESSLLLRWTQRNLYVCSMSTPWMFTGVIWGVFMGCLSPVLCLEGIDMKMVDAIAVDKVLHHDPPVFQFVFFSKMSNNGCVIRRTCAGGWWLHSIFSSLELMPSGPVAFLSLVFLSPFLSWSKVMERLRGIVLHSWYFLCSLVSAIMFSILLGRNITFTMMTDGLCSFFFLSQCSAPALHSLFLLHRECLWVLQCQHLFSSVNNRTVAEWVPCCRF